MFIELDREKDTSMANSNLLLLSSCLALSLTSTAGGDSAALLAESRRLFTGRSRRTIFSSCL